MNKGLNSLDTLRSRLQRKHTVKKKTRYIRPLGVYNEIPICFKILQDRGSDGHKQDCNINRLSERHSTSCPRTVGAGCIFSSDKYGCGRRKNCMGDIQYNKEIESTFRCLKTDLDLRPIYHKRDDATMAHLHLGILALYGEVNTVRQRLKVSGINHSWTEILRIARTQKMVTTRGTNMTDQLIGESGKVPFRHRIFKEYWMLWVIRNIRLSKNL
ncbi:MAG: hypothetical protein IPI42_08705 [Saprospiraceae bacterium]|nr:hypothetical protein [Candidatus Parvibacillus calidus]